MRTTSSHANQGVFAIIANSFAGESYDRRSSTHFENVFLIENVRANDYKTSISLMS